MPFKDEFRDVDGYQTEKYNHSAGNKKDKKHENLLYENLLDENLEEIRRNPQKHPIKDPKQYAEIPKQKHPKQKHL